MGDISWARELPERVIINIPPTHNITQPQGRMVQMSRATFERIGDYTRSSPTSPSAGRIYRKNLGWPDHMEDNWFVYIVVDEPPGTAPVCKRCNGRRIIRYVGREVPTACDRCNGTGVSRPGQYHVPYTPILTDTALPLRQRTRRRKPVSNHR
jgi:hypothetical protein